MFIRICVALLSTLLSGCYATTGHRPDELNAAPLTVSEGTLTVKRADRGAPLRELVDGGEVLLLRRDPVFDAPLKVWVNEGMLVVKPEASQDARLLDASQVRRIDVKEFSGRRTALLAGGVGLAVTIVAVVIGVVAANGGIKMGSFTFG